MGTPVPRLRPSKASKADTTLFVSYLKGSATNGSPILRGADTTSTFSSCAAVKVPAAPVYDVRRTLTRYAGRYDVACTKRSGYTYAVVPDGNATLRISRQGVIKLGSFKLPIEEVTGSDFGEFLLNAPTYSDTAFKLTVQDGKGVTITPNAYSGAISRFTVNEAEDRGSICDVRGFAAEQDEVEPTDHGEPGPGLRNPSAVIGAVIAGDYSLACRAFGQPASSPASPRRLSIDRDGRMRVDDIEVAGPSSRGSLQIGVFAGTQPSVLPDHSVQATRLIRQGTAATDARTAQLRFNDDGTLVDAALNLENGSPLSCTVDAARTSADATLAAQLAGSALQRAERLDCVTSSAGNGLPSGSVDFAIAADGGITLGDRRITAAEYASASGSGGLSITDDLSFGYGSNLDSVATISVPDRVVELKFEPGSQRQTQRLIYKETGGSGPSTTCRRP